MPLNGAGEPPDPGRVPFVVPFPPGMGRVVFPPFPPPPIGVPVPSVPFEGVERPEPKTAISAKPTLTVEALTESTVKRSDCIVLFPSEIETPVPPFGS